MSHPLPGASFAVSPAGVTALADELTILAADLAGDVERIRSAAACLPSALEGPEGWSAGATATSWALLCDVMAGRAGALAQMLTTAVAAYLAEDAALAGSARPGRGPR